ncbi:uncharacterized protein LOC118735996 isoform X2 [Rhagoletis pomonella]|uniref:uncharacterized protein LOC118735996 isoform X2 n=1 Tax=Rhagoletis pomonella TaxID=28610 RepID=UPI00177DF9D7|nr:uncharacterized protein LOC118735996 isoform X2 [Rhagoletis pomonella]
MRPLYNSLKFLEPTLKIEASTTSNLGNKCPSPLTSSGSPCDAETNVESDDSQPTPSTSRAAGVRRRVQKDDDGFSEVVERALETMSAAGKSDAWDDLGNFIASNGREWAAESPQLAKEFKADMYEMVFNYQEKFARPIMTHFL